jgi:hypothetical protein
MQQRGVTLDLGAIREKSNEMGQHALEMRMIRPADPIEMPLVEPPYMRERLIQRLLHMLLRTRG